MSEIVRRVALQICKSRTCEGVSCCQWPANMGRLNCNAKNGAYDDAARAAIEAMSELSAMQVDRAAQALREYECQHSLVGYAPWENLNEKIKQHFRGKVRVVVDAVGEA